jgi:penicillin-binding protein 2
MNPFSQRKYLIAMLVVIAALVFTGKLFYMQVINPAYKLSAENNSRREVIQYPARGLIYDRNGLLLVSNQAAYDVMLNPSQMEAFDTSSFCTILGITVKELEEGIKKARDYNRFSPSVFQKQVSSEVASVLQEKLYKYPGFFVQDRTLRQYPFNHASHLLGYVGETDKKTIDSDPYYALGDYIGVSGIEKVYENILRGSKGRKYYMVDVHSRITGPWEEGRYDEPLERGTDLVLTLDAGLQQYGEKLIEGFSGSVVAIEPATGEILSLISAPFYKPDLLVGRGLSRNFELLSGDPANPLFNRAVSASYPPGSTFKIINGLIGLKEKVIVPGSSFSCEAGYHARGLHVGCHYHASPLDLRQGIAQSCNAYFCNVLKRIMENQRFARTDSAFSSWRTDVCSFGFGERLGTDIVGELRGLIPRPDYYNKYYGIGRWNYLTIISLSIGQGELGITPLQMANMSAAIANRGWYYTPHILKEIRNNERTPEAFATKHYTSIDSSLFEIAIDGMESAVNGGEGVTARIAAIEGVVVCGKTGTAQNPFGDDHSIFIAFAPRENPRIAIAVYVENVGFGSTWAAPIASLMIEKYLTGEVKRTWLESYMEQKKIVLHSQQAVQQAQPETDD